MPEFMQAEGENPDCDAEKDTCNLKRGAPRGMDEYVPGSGMVAEQYNR